MQNNTTDRPTFVTHLECGKTKARYAADQLLGLSDVGSPLIVRYDVEGISKALSKEELRSRPADLWRYREFLPVRQTKNIVSLGEIMTPLIDLPSMQKGQGRLIVKDEGRLPTGSFKARGLCMAVSMAAFERVQTGSCYCFCFT